MDAKMDTPKIKLGSKTYTAKKPKTKLWRKVIKFNREYSKVNIAESDEAVDFILELLSESFGSEEVTPEKIEEDLDLDELLPKFKEVTGWIGRMVSSKAQEIPPGKNVQQTD